MLRLPMRPPCLPSIATSNWDKMHRQLTSVGASRNLLTKTFALESSLRQNLRNEKSKIYTNIFYFEATLRGGEDLQKRHV